ncbi:transcriptional repressor LexA [Phaeobacter sp. QD34_3]|uniref:transcriptional repressor LexA n=1 Tax=unclassified Phaeobacter TaxID=2621772 RepID=UPI00237FAF05|nr:MULTISPECIES: transcriptional repressor LexA [unclassified Phaeobacter]MDE4131655.1 transcriptional repressor LexA [Phaeobacter sp. QD34_3]MDE4135256.1 transcriptional repressor LexA [Phaeobacter sp. QD34_24]MDE4174577.1 transcriptional repressor LexA [Phaeobacter sp. PT47_59]
MLTQKQLDLLEFIHTRLQRDGVPPSFDEMKVALDLRSKSGIHRLITALEERGFIRRLAHRARAIEILRLPDSIAGGGAGFSPRVIAGGADDNDHSAQGAAPMAAQAAAAMELPVMGRIAAGVPIEAISQISNRVSVPSSMLSANGAHYALEVRGDSMIEAGINDGDIVVIRESDTADDGDIVVALVEGHEATLKKIYRRHNNTVELEAANPAYKTRCYPADQVKVQGRLVGLIRSY